MRSPSPSPAPASLLWATADSRWPACPRSTGAPSRGRSWPSCGPPASSTRTGATREDRAAPPAHGARLVAGRAGGASEGFEADGERDRDGKVRPEPTARLPDRTALPEED